MLGQEAPRTCRHQRVHDRGVGVDQRAISRRHAIKGHALGLRIAAGNVPNFVDLAHGRLGVGYPGPAQRRPDADDGQFRHAGRRACRLRHARDGGCVQQAVRGVDSTQGGRPDRYADRGAVDCSRSVVPAAENLRSAPAVLSSIACESHAGGSVYAVPQLGTQRLGAAAQV